MNASAQNTKRQIVLVLRGYSIKKIGVFGFFVRGKAKKDSDVDSLVEFAGNKKACLI
jgi:predicted nucleotidyltransferase